MTIGLFLLAIAPVVAIVWYIYHKDKYEHEPMSFLFVSFMLGVLCAVVVPFITGRMNWLTDGFEGRQMEIFLYSFVIVAFLEEFFKFISLRYFMYYRRVFNEPIDGIVYGVMIGMGFATLENLYFVLEGGWQTGVLRMFTAVPAHAVFGIIMGYYTGKAKYISERNLEFTIKAFGVPVVLHGLYNYLLMQDNYPYLGIVAIVGLWVIAFRYVRKMIKEQQDASPFRK